MRNRKLTMINCAVIGATGFTGIELVKILLRHKQVRITALTTRQKESIPVRDLIPTLPADVSLEIKTFSFPEVRKRADAVFLCLPHTEAMETAQEFRAAGKVVIDLSADFRLRNAGIYEKWYGVKHRNPVLLKHAVYGLPEMNRKAIRTADLVANPGCYPTASALGIFPLLRAKLVDGADIVIDAKSGVSGAGKKLVPATQFCAVGENFSAYKVNRHQHRPEIEQTLSDAAGRPVRVAFVPHLLPVDRGILATIYLKARKGVTSEDVGGAFMNAYRKEPFVRVRPDGVFPCLKDVQFTNFCDIGFTLDEGDGRLIVVSAIDNLLKGASGQAVQNLNIRFGFSEQEGLTAW